MRAELDRQAAKESDGLAGYQYLVDLALKSPTNRAQKP